MSKRNPRTSTAAPELADLLSNGGNNWRDMISEIRATTPHALSARQRENMSRRFMHLGRMGDLTPERYRAQLIAERQPDIPSRNTLYAWRAINQKDPLLLAGRNHRAGRKSTVASEALHFYFTYRAAHPRASSKAAYEKMKVEAQEQGWEKLHSEDRYRAIFNTLPPSQRHMMKFGSKARFSEHGFTLSQPEVTPNQLWECDAKNLDCYVRRIEGGKPFKPWLVSYLDHASRMIMGWAIFDHSPTTRDILLALKHAVLPHKHKPWGGLPQCIQTDNASTFGATFTTVLGAMGIKHQYIPRKCPAKNGRIERSHRIHDEEFCDNLIPHTMWDPRPGKSAKPVRFHEIWERFEERFHAYVERYCQIRPHGALNGLTPYEFWIKNLPDSSPDEEEAKIEQHLVVSHDTLLKVERGTITLGGHAYTSPKLLSYSGRDVQLVYPPEGPSSGKVRAFYKGQEIGALSRPDQCSLFAQSVLAAEKQAIAGERDVINILTVMSNRYSKNLIRSYGCQHGEPPEPPAQEPTSTPPAEKPDRMKEIAEEPYPEEPSEA